MITLVKIQEMIAKLIAEEATLRSTHELMIREHQQRTQRIQDAATANANRFQQIAGALSVLKDLLVQEQSPGQPTEEPKPTEEPPP